MTLATFLIVLFILFMIFFFIKYFAASLPAPFNPWIVYLAAGLIIIFLFIALLSFLGMTNIFNTPIGIRR